MPNKFKYNEFIDSKLGRIPKKWEIVPLNKYCDILRGFHSSYVEKSRLINLNQKVNRGDYLDKSNYKYYDENTKVPSIKFARYNDILLNSLGEGTLGRVHLYLENTQNVVVDEPISIIRPDNDNLFVEYVFCYLKNPESKFRIENLKTGSTGMTSLSIKKLRSFEIVVPPNIIQKEFVKIASTLFKKKSINNKEIEKLNNLRDKLIPKLMSGEIDVSEIEI